MYRHSLLCLLSSSLGSTLQRDLPCLQGMDPLCFSYDSSDLVFWLVRE